MNLANAFEAVKKLPEEVIGSVKPHIGGMSFFTGMLNEDMTGINLEDISKKDALKIAVRYCKKEMKNSKMSIPERAKFIAGLPKLIRDSENNMRILNEAVKLIENPGNTFPLNQEWAAFFFQYSKKISDKDLQKILGKILAEELENKDGANSEIVELSEEYFNAIIENMKIS